MADPYEGLDDLVAPVAPAPTPAPVQSQPQPDPYAELDSLTAPAPAPVEEPQQVVPPIQPQKSPYEYDLRGTPQPGFMTKLYHAAEDNGVEGRVADYKSRVAKYNQLHPDQPWNKSYKEPPSHEELDAQLWDRKQREDARQSQIKEANQGYLGNADKFVGNTVNSAVQSGRSVDAKMNEIAAKAQDLPWYANAIPNVAAANIYSRVRGALTGGTAEGYNRLSKEAQAKNQIYQAAREESVKNLPKPIARAATMMADLFPRLSTGGFAPVIFAAEAYTSAINDLEKRNDQLPPDQRLSRTQMESIALFSGGIQSFTPPIFKGAGPLAGQLVGKGFKAEATLALESFAKEYPTLITQRVLDESVKRLGGIDDGEGIFNGDKMLTDIVGSVIAGGMNYGFSRKNKVEAPTVVKKPEISREEAQKVREEYDLRPEQTVQKTDAGYKVDETATVPAGIESSRAKFKEYSKKNRMYVDQAINDLGYEPGKLSAQKRQAVMDRVEELKTQMALSELGLYGVKGKREGLGSPQEEAARVHAENEAQIKASSDARREAGLAAAKRQQEIAARQDVHMHEPMKPIDFGKEADAIRDEQFRYESEISGAVDRTRAELQDDLRKAVDAKSLAVSAQDRNGIVYADHKIKSAQAAIDRFESAPEAEPKAPERRGRERFASDEEVIREKLKAKGYSDEQIKDFESEGFLAPDRVTGFTEARAGEARSRTVERALAHVEKTGEKGVYVDADLKNLGGLNKALTATGADKAYRAMSALLKEELHKIGADVHLFRHGGDEMSAVIINADKDTVDAAMLRAKNQVEALAKKEKWDTIPHTKEGREGGTGIHFGSTEVDPVHSIEETIKIAEAQTEARKGSNDYGTGQAQAVGSGESSGEPAPASDAGKTGRAASIRSRQKQSGGKNPKRSPEGSEAAPNEPVASKEGVGTTGDATRGSEKAVDSGQGREVDRSAETRIGPAVGEGQLNSVKNKMGESSSGVPRDIKEVQSRFPGRPVKDNGDGTFDVTLADGKKAKIVYTDSKNVQIDWDAAAKARGGKKYTAEEKEAAQALGGFYMLTADGKPVDGHGLIKIAHDIAEGGTLTHEQVHLARSAGLFTDAEWDALVKKHSDKSKSIEQQEEDIAGAAGALNKPTRTGKSSGFRLRDWVRKLTGMSKDADVDINELMATSEFWDRTPKMINGRRYVSIQFRGNPERANPMQGEAARNAYREAQENYDPGERSYAEAEKAAKKLLNKKSDELEAELIALADKGGYGGEHTIAAKKLVEDLMTKALKSNDPEAMQRAMAMARGYMAQGSIMAREMSARRDLNQTPEQRRKQAILESLATPSDKIVNQIEKAAPAERRRLEAQWSSKLDEVKNSLKSLGIDLSNIDSIAKDERAAARAVNFIEASKASWWVKLMEFRRNAMLSGPATHAANISGSVLNLARLYANRLVGVGTGQSNLKEMRSIVQAALSSMPWKAAAKDFIRAYHTEKPIFENEFKTAKEVAAQDINHRPAIEGRKGEIIRIPQRLLQGADQFMISFITRIEVAAKAEKIANKKGLSGEAKADFIEGQIENIKSDAWKESLDFAQYATFHERDPNAFHGIPDAVADAAIGLRKKLPVLEIPMPFITTPVNVLKQSIKATPLGMYDLAREIHSASKTGDYSKVSSGAAEQLVGMVVLGALLMQDDKDKKITGTRDTNNPTSIMFGDSAVSYGKLDPVATGLAIMIDGIEIARNKPNAESVLNGAVETMSNIVKDKTFTRGLGDLLRVFDADNKGFYEKATDYAASTASSFSPNVIKSGIRAFQDEKTEQSTWKGGPTGLQRATEKSFAGGNYPDRDLWGRPIQNPGSPLSRLASPIKVGAARGTEADRMISAWNLDNPDEKITLRPPGKTYTEKGVKHVMSEAEYDKFAATSGEAAMTAFNKFKWNIKNPSKKEVEELKFIIDTAREVTRDLTKRGISKTPKQIADIVGGRVYSARSRKNTDIAKK